MILADIAFAGSVALNIYLVIRTAKLKVRCERSSRTIEVLGRQGKIDHSDVNKASQVARGERDINHETRRTLYGGKQ